MKARLRSKLPAKRSSRPAKSGPRHKNGSAATTADVAGGFKIAATPVPLSDVERAWPADDSTRRTVFTMTTEAA